MKSFNKEPFQVGDRIRVERTWAFPSRAFEPGTITAIDGEVAEIVFDNPNLGAGYKLGWRIEHLEFEHLPFDLGEEYFF